MNFRGLEERKATSGRDHAPIQSREYEVVLQDRRTPEQSIDTPTDQRRRRQPVI